MLMTPPSVVASRMKDSVGLIFFYLYERARD